MSNWDRNSKMDTPSKLCHLQLSMTLTVFQTTQLDSTRDILFVTNTTRTKKKKKKKNVPDPDLGFGSTGCGVGLAWIWGSQALYSTDCVTHCKA
mmetsp:Transcript_11503/g.23398  ORF Transcript_11503/g.23398 Transcript_11503/m.23398 type:complete len:94 (+) Transcript_11503:4120-4401(+)